MTQTAWIAPIYRQSEQQQGSRIEALADEMCQVGNYPVIRLCRRALSGDEAAHMGCLRLIAAREILWAQGLGRHLERV